MDAKETKANRRSAVAQGLRERMNGLSIKLLALTVLFVMISEVFVYLPSIAKFRNDWLTDRLNRAETAVIMLSGANGQTVDREQINQILESLDAITLAHRVEGRRIPLGMIDMPPPVSNTFNTKDWGVFSSIGAALETMVAPPGRTIRVIGTPPGSNELVEIVVSEQPLKDAMLIYSRNVIALSLIISILTATMIYFTLNYLFVKPVRRMADNMIDFTSAPDAPNSIIKPTGRRDEIGVAEDRLAELQKDLQSTLHQQKRLADLGLAVSKINHDLRNILSSVQLFTDRISMLPDPTVQRVAPKMLNALDRAIQYCQSTLAYGSAKEKPPEKRLFKLHPIAEEIASLLNLPENAKIDWENNVPDELEMSGDPDQIFRVLMNLSRNAVKAMEEMDGDVLVRRLTIAAEASGNKVEIRVQDTGPGMPEVAKQNLFTAFKGSVGKGGTGLGLAIAQELVVANDGEISLSDKSGPGACFKMTFVQSS